MEQAFNKIIGVSSENATMAHEFIPDTTSPIIAYWNLDMNRGMMIFWFSETVNALSFFPQSLTLQASANISEIRSQAFTLTSGFHSLMNDTVIYYNFSKYDLDKIKQLESIGTMVNTSFIAYNNTLISDMNGNDLTSRANGDAKQVLYFTPDTTPPTLIKFILDIDEGIVLLTFSETVKADSIVFLSFSFQNISDNVGTIVSSFTLTNGSVSTVDSTDIQLNFTKSDLDAINEIYSLSTSINNSYISIVQGGIMDMNGNDLIYVTQQASVFIADTTRPSLVSFNLDLNDGLLMLTFSETVNTYTLRVPFIYVQHSQLLDSDFSVRLGVSEYPFDNSTMITISLNFENLNEIKRLRMLATNENNTYISFNESLILDISGNRVVPSLGLKVNKYIPDHNSPELIQFLLNLTSYQLILILSETVSSLSLNITSIFFQNVSDSSSLQYEYFQLSDASYSSSLDGTDLIIYLGMVDLNALKRIRNLCTNINNTFLYFDSSLLSDTNGNIIKAEYSNNAVSVSNFFGDTFRPKLISFDLDMDNGELTLYYSETIDIASLSINDLTLQISQNVSDGNYFVHNLLENCPGCAYTNASDNHIITIKLERTNLNGIKRNYILAQSLATTYLSFPFSHASDTSMNHIIPYSSLSALGASNFTPDTTPPQLLLFSLNLTSEELSLTFDEIINITSPIINRISILNTPYLVPNTSKDQTNIYMLTSSTLVTEENSDVITVSISKYDINAIKLMTDLAVSLSTTFVYLFNKSVTDNSLFGNPNMIIILNSGEFFPDMIDPRVLNYTVDMDIGVLTLNFDEPVNISSIDFTGILLQNGDVSNNVNNEFRLTGGNTVSGNGLQIVINLLILDLNELQRRTLLFTSMETSYLVIDSSFIRDMNNNPILPIENGAALQTLSFRSDSTGPALVRFDLDMDQGLISLYFTEIVNISSFLINKLTLQASPSVGNQSLSQYTLTGGNLLTLDNSISVSFLILDYDLDVIKSRRICSDKFTSWVVFPSGIIQDMTTISVLPQVDSVNATLVGDFYPDTTHPYLLSYNVDLSKECITLTFSETIITSSLSIQSLLFQSVEIPVRVYFESYYLTSDSATYSPDNPIIIIELGTTDLNEIKRKTDLMIDKAHTYLSFHAEHITDYVGNIVEGIPPNFPVQVSNFTSDFIHPELSAYSLNLTSEILLLYFSETMNFTSFSVDQITFLSEPISQELLNAIQYHTLSGYKNYLSEPTSVIMLMLLDSDIDRLKQLYSLVTSASNSFISISNLTAFDMFENSVIAISTLVPLSPRSFFPDTIRPYLRSFELDLDGTGKLVFSFSETMKISSFNLSQLHLQHLPQSSYKYNFYYSRESQTNSSVVSLYFDIRDLNSLKLDLRIALNSESTYITFTSSFINDMNNNAIQAVSNGNGLRVSQFIPDSTPPQLDSFSFDMSLGIITLTFSEIMYSMSLKPSSITLQNNPNSAGNNITAYTLTGGIISSINSTTVTVTLSFFDLNNLKLLTNFAISTDTTFISFERETIEDVNGNDVTAIYSTTALKASTFVQDMVRPTIDRFQVDMNAGLLEIDFSEAVSIFYLQPIHLTLLDCCYYSESNNFSNSSIYNHTLTGGACIHFDQTKFTCSLTNIDFNEIKLQNICTDIHQARDCCLTIEDPIFDLSNNSVLPIFEGCGFPVDIFIPDNTPPNVLEFAEFNLNEGTITMNLDETINSGSFILSTIDLQSFIRNPISMFTLTSSYLTSPNSDIITFQLTTSDIHSIKLLPDLCSDQNNCWLSFSNLFLLDMANNTINPISSFNAIAATKFTDDITPPNLLSYSFNLQSDFIRLTFDEPVSAKSLRPTSLVIQNNNSSLASTLSYTLTGGYSSDSDGSIISLFLSIYDANNLKSFDNLASTLFNTFIYINDTFIHDLASRFPNNMLPISEYSALRTSNYTKDSTPPVVISFSLDLNSDTILIYFDEPIRISTLEIRKFVLVSDKLEPVDSLVLRGGIIDTFSDYNGTSSILIYLIQSDIRYLKLSTSLAQTEDSTFLIVRENAVRDMFNNSIREFQYSDAIKASRLIADITRASLIGFSLDMDDGSLNLTYDDIIRTSTLYPSAFTIQNSRILNLNYMYVLTSSTATNSFDGYYITLQISQEDLNAIKLNTGLGTNIGDTYLSMRADAFDDSFARDVLAVTHEKALKANFYIEDRSAPYLFSFTLDMDLGIMILTFDEILRGISFDSQRIVLHNTYMEYIDTVSYSLKTSSSSMVNSTTVTVYISKSDLNAIKALPSLVTSPLDAFISYTSLLAVDMVGNLVIPIHSNSSFNVSVFIMDTTRPNLISFSLNLTSGLLFLTFDETVNASTLSVTELALQDEHLISLFPLTAGSFSVNNSITIFIVLSVSDLNGIKALQLLATNLNNTYLSARRNTIVDMNGNFLQDLSIQANEFFGDVIDPELETFDLDLDSNLLTLYFSETINADSIIPQFFTLHNSKNSSLFDHSHYTLRDGNIILSNASVIYVNLTPLDINEIQRISNLAISNHTTYLSVLQRAALDMNNNQLVPINSEVSLSVNDYSEDRINPSLVSFILDMDIGALYLSFSETVRVSTLNISSLTIQNSLNSDVQFSLTSNSSTNSSNNASLVLWLGRSDLNYIQKESSLATNRSNTYLSFTFDLVTDMNINQVTPYYSFQSLHVSEYIPDETNPRLQRFDINLNFSELTFFFSEIIRGSTILVTGITLTSSRSSSYSGFTLTSDSFPEVDNNDIITIKIGLSDSNQIKKQLQLSTNITNSYLSIESNAVRDMNNNFVLAILPPNALQASQYIEDMIRPYLIEFSLDMNSALLLLTFSETILISSIDLTSVKLQSSPILNNQHIDLQIINSNISAINDPDIRVILGFNNANALKVIPVLGTDPTNLFISFSSNFLTDINFNNIIAISQLDALKVTNFDPDVEGPLLLSFALDLTFDMLTLYFDEVVNIDSLSLSLLTLSSDIVGSNSFRFSTAYELNTIDNSTSLSLNLSTDDVNAIKLDLLLATSLNNTYLVMPDESIFDMALIANPIVRFFPIRAKYFTSDEVSPNLLSFIVDMDSGIIILNFDEPVLVSTFNSTNSLYLSASQNSSFSSNYLIKDAAVNGTNDVVLTIILSNSNLNEIKKRDYFFVSRGTSFLHITSNLIKDMNNNPVKPLSVFLQTIMFINDTTMPIILNFGLDMDEGILSLTFPETVDVSSVMFESITFQKAANVTLSTNRYSLTDGSLYMLEDNTVAYLLLVNFDLNALKEMRIARSSDVTYLAIESSAIVDKSNQRVQALKNGVNTLKVSRYLPDSTSPSLDIYVLDLTKGILTLNFSETVAVLSLNVTELTILGDNNVSSHTEHFTLTSNTTSNSTDSHILTLRLGILDLNMIKQLTLLSTSVANTFLSLTSAFIADTFGNPIIPINRNTSLQATDYFTDTVRPQLRSFSIDLDLRIITLYFTETVNVSSMDITQLTLHCSNSTFSNCSYSLKNSSSSDTNQPTLAIQLSNTDFNEIARREQLATGLYSSFISISTDFIYDMSFNPVLPNGVPNLQAISYTSDKSRPSLLSFSLDLNNGILLLTFNEVVNISSFFPFSLRLQMNATSKLASYVLTGFKSSFAYDEASQSIDLRYNQPILFLSLLESDLNDIKRITLLATSKSNTFISFDSNLIADMGTNPIDEISFLSAQSVYMFVPDRIKPSLISFDFDLNTGVINFTFSETVNLSSLMADTITIQSSENSSSTNSFAYYTLTGGNLEREYDDVFIQVKLTMFDINEIKKLDFLATSNFNTYIVVQNNTVLDMFNNDLQTVSTLHGLMVNNYINDTTPPYLVSFSLNLSSEILSLTLNEPVELVSTQASQIALSNNMTQSYSLTGGNVYTQSNEETFEIALTTPDLNYIKQNSDLAVSIDSTFILFTTDLISDRNANLVIPIISPIKAQDFYPDFIRPTLDTCDLDMNIGLLTLFFSETVNASSLNATYLSLFSSRDFSALWHRLSNYSFTNSSNSEIVSIIISSDDLNNIKQLEYVATDISNSFIVINQELVFDMNFNPLIPIPHTAALKIRNFTHDTTSPILVMFSLDMNIGVLMLSFSETINASSIVISNISIQSLPSNSLYSVTLTSSLPSVLNLPILTITLSEYDLNQIKRIYSLATMVNSTYLHIIESTIRDLNMNPSVAIQSYQALKVFEFTSDTTNPSVENFSFDLNSGILVISMSETPNLSTFDSIYISLQSSTSNSSTYYTLSYNISNLEFLTFTNFSFTLHDADLNEIKSLESLGTSKPNLFMSFTSSLIRDAFGNIVEPRLRSNPLQVSTIILDTTCPNIVQFSFNLNRGVILLTFDETINVTSFITEGLQFQSKILPSLTDFRLGNATATRIHNTIVQVTISQVDLDYIKIFSELANQLSNTFLNFSARSFTDMSGNYLCPKVLLAWNFTQDTTLPDIVSFDFDLDSSLLILTFSETILPILSVGNIFTLHHNRSLNSQFHTVSDGTSVGGSADHSNPTILTIYLVQTDIDRIKSLSLLAVSNTSIYLSVQANSLSDSAFNFVRPSPASEFILVGIFIPDSTPPSLISFQLDMNYGIISLFFSEAVDSTKFYMHSILLQSTESSSTFSHGLTGGSFKNLSLTEIEVYLTMDDINSIKRIPQFAQDKSTTFLSLLNFLILDYAAIRNVNITKNSALNAEIYFPDISPPSLLAVEINLTSENLTLHFDEIVSPFSLVASNIEFQRTLIGHSVLRLQGYSAISAPLSTIVSITLLKQDLDIIKLDSLLAISANSTCITLLDNAVNDVALISNSNTMQNMCVIFGGFYGDFLPPFLLAFAIDLDSGELVLNFNEPVNALTLNATSLTFLSSQLDIPGNQKYTLTGGTTSSINGIMTTINITIEDLNNIKALTSLLSSNLTTFLAHTDYLVQDMNRNRIIQISLDLPQRVTLFVDDSTRPTLVLWGLDLTENVITLTFDETVDPKTLNVSGITLQNTPAIQTTLTYTISPLTIILSDKASTVVLLNISTTDSNSLKREKIALTSTSAYITLSSSVIQDVNGYDAIERPPGVSALLANFFVPDFVSPMLETFKLNLTSEELILTFSETVDYQTLIPNLIKLSNVNLSLDNLAFHQLQESIVKSTSDSHILVITLSTKDLNELKLRRNVASSYSNTFFTGSSFLKDTFNNTIVPVSLLQVSEFIEDVIRPVLISFDLDMDSGTFMFILSEVVDTSTLDTSAITVSSFSNLTGQSFQLSGSYLHVSSNGDVISFTMTRDDVNALKSLQNIAVSLNTTFLAVRANTIFDMNNNPLSVTTLNCSSFVEDSTPPYLLNFTIDLDTGLLVLTFDETVLDSSLILSFWVLRNNYSVVFETDSQHQFILGFTFSINAPTTYIYISKIDLNEIKRKNICTKELMREDCYLAYRVDAVEDMNRNGIVGCQELAFRTSLQSFA